MIDFDRVWRAYPADYAPCKRTDGSSAFDNQCAIRFGLALMDGGVDMSSFPGVRCWFGHRGRHLLRGEEVAAWMRSKTATFGRVEIRRDADESSYVGRRGLIFCRNFWGLGNQGDHIDLWDRDRMQTGIASYISRSQEVWFWEVDATTTEWLDRHALTGTGAAKTARFRSADQASADEVEIAEWFIGNYPDKYDPSLLPRLRYSRQRLIAGWPLMQLIHLPIDDADWDELAFLNREGPDSISENGLVRFGGTLTIHPDEVDNGGLRLSSHVKVVAGQEPIWVGYVFDGQSYHETVPSAGRAEPDDGDGWEESEPA